MSYKAPAIPTKYAGVQFRSRLEARWAAFFDLLGWPWEYEPIDLNGYIPDFVLAFPEPMIVEVKPYLDPVSEWFWASASERAEHDASKTLDKIANSGWTGEGLLVGASVLTHKHAMGHDPTSRETVNPGILFRPYPLESLESHYARVYAESFGIKACCGGPVDVVGYFACRRCGDHDKGPTLMAAAEVIAKWREAGNRVQWRGLR